MGSIIQEILYSLSSKKAEVAALPSSLGDVHHVAISVLSEVIASSTDSLARLAKASYVHANGFEKLVCGATAPEGFKIRLHVWSAAANDAQTHDHGWSFYSHILLGSISSTEYEVDTEPGAHSVYRIPNLRAREAGATLKCMQRNVSLRASSQRTLTGGEGYGLPSNKLHRVVTSRASGAVTLVLQSHHTQAYSHVVLTQGQAIANAYPTKKFSTVAFVERLIDLRQQLLEKRPD
ncbi:MAG: hypothetical protein QOD28_505 [Acidobacteriota bacterium]|nr:hypothetical protein [Acidobacteriota bacterium]